MDEDSDSHILNQPNEIRRNSNKDNEINNRIIIKPDYSCSETLIYAISNL